MAWKSLLNKIKPDNKNMAKKQSSKTEEKIDKQPVKVFMRYNNSLLYIDMSDNVLDYNEIQVQFPKLEADNPAEPPMIKAIQTFKIKNKVVDDYFAVINVTKNKHFVVLPINEVIAQVPPIGIRKFDYDNFINLYLKHNISGMSRKVLNSLLESHIESEDYETACLIRDELNSRPQTENSEINNQ